MAIWKYGRVSIEITSPTISTLGVWTNLKVVFTQASKQLILVAVLSILKSNHQAKSPTQIACVNEPLMDLRPIHSGHNVGNAGKTFFFYWKLIINTFDN